ncbi:hypothetical protein K2173_011486 [Erythroxylum novogranatense]|uniref:GDSL esterase/lipase 6 n=1 Tax=Erythroxylum novogranatense TaxID=1862640 RepID=A0AAV8S6A1_9ROSI|nr:hypothetical protein K2173_011486 [Erythroxylum novogranatense]
MLKLLLALLPLLSSTCLLVSGYSARAIFIFGDSIFDAGNNHFNKNCSAQTDFPHYGSSFFHHPIGRFTNGRTVADFISQFMGIELQESYLEAQLAVTNGSRRDYPTNGVNFASAGSGVLRETNEDLGVISIQEQLQQFQKLIQQNHIDKTLIPKSLFFFESGSNDIFNYFLLGDKRDLDTYVQTMLIQVADLVDQLYKLGARRIALFSLGPVGCVPARALLPNAPVDKCFDNMNLMGISVRYTGTTAVYGAVYDIVQRFRSVPSRYGLLDVTNACCGEGTLGGLVQCGREGYKMCPNPDQFLFWDYFHPSEHTYKLISMALWNGKKSTVRPASLKTLADLPRSHALFKIK